MGDNALYVCLLPFRYGEETTPGFLFPKTIPETFLTPKQQCEKYGLGKDGTPSAVALEIDSFLAWSSALIQLDRPKQYATAVQTTTSAKQVDTIRAYLGYVDLYHRSCLVPLSLTVYTQPKLFIQFMSYLQARDVGRAHLGKHVSLALKVNCYLAVRSGPVDPNAGAMKTWLTNLEAQVRRSLPPPVKGALPDFDDIGEWAEGLGEEAMSMYRNDMDTRDSITKPTAQKLQEAAIAMLVIGTDVPPCRLSIIKSMKHPDYVGKTRCCDPDCRRPNTCEGNHFLLIPREQAAEDDMESGTESDGEEPLSVRVIAIHHKTSENKGIAPIEYTIPPGLLSDVLVAHIKHGQPFLNELLPKKNIMMFMSNAGNPFNDQTFNHYWEGLMARSGQRYFPPSLARTSYVERFIGANGKDVDLCEGAATCMGNTPKQWRASYAPNLKRQKAQASVDAHASFRSTSK
jgi:hypothetical protein